VTPLARKSALAAVVTQPVDDDRHGRFVRRGSSVRVGPTDARS
jgi:hypothetical protein